MPPNETVSPSSTAGQDADDLFALDVDLVVEHGRERSGAGGLNDLLAALEQQQDGGGDLVGDLRAVDVAIRRLREKVEDEPASPKHIITKRGMGYYFAEG